MSGRVWFACLPADDSVDVGGFFVLALSSLNQSSVVTATNGSGNQGCGSGSACILKLFPPGSGSAFNLRIRIQERKVQGKKKRNNARKLVVIVILFKKIKFDQLHGFSLLLGNLFGLFQLQKTLPEVILYKFWHYFVKLDPDPHKNSSWILIQNKLLQIHSPGGNIELTLTNEHSIPESPNVLPGSGLVAFFAGSSTVDGQNSWFSEK